MDNESPPLVSASNTSASTPTDTDTAADVLTTSDKTPDDGAGVALPEDIDIQSLGDAFTWLHSSGIEPDPEEALGNRDGQCIVLCCVFQRLKPL